MEDWQRVITAQNNISSRGANLTEFADSELFFHDPKRVTDPNIHLLSGQNIDRGTPNSGQ